MQKSAEPPSVVRLSPDAVRTAGIETAVVGGTAGGGVLTLTGTLGAKPWTPEEQAALSDAASADAKLRLAEANFQRLSRLSRDGVVARQDLDASRAERDQARAAAVSTCHIEALSSRGAKRRGIRRFARDDRENESATIYLECSNTVADSVYSM